MLGSTVGNFLSSVKQHADALLGNFLCQHQGEKAKETTHVKVHRDARKPPSLLEKVPKQRSSFTRASSGAISSSSDSPGSTASNSRQQSHKDVFDSLVSATRTAEIEEARIKRDLEARQKIYDSQRRRNSQDELHVKFNSTCGNVVREVKVQQRLDSVHGLACTCETCNKKLKNAVAKHLWLKKHEFDGAQRVHSSIHSSQA